MPSSSIIIPFRNLLSVLLLLPLVLSCRQDELILPVPPVSGKGETAEVTFCQDSRFPGGEYSWCRRERDNRDYRTDVCR